MGRGKHCTPNQRASIVELSRSGRSQRQIANQLNCSKKMVENALEYFRKNQTIDNVARKDYKRKTSVRTDRKIIRMSKSDPRLSSRDINRAISDETEVPISDRTVRRRLVEVGLHGRVARKRPLITARQRKMRVEFARSHARWTANQWKFVLWSDESKIDRMAPSAKRYVRRPKGEEFNPRYTSHVVKHGGGNIKVWGCFSWNGVGPIYRIRETLTAPLYVEILKDVMLPWAEENMPVIWKFQQYNDPKHTANITKQFFHQNHIDVLEWAASSADLNPIEHL